jgi:hypothetical protein
MLQQGTTIHQGMALLHTVPLFKVDFAPEIRDDLIWMIESLHFSESVCGTGLLPPAQQQIDVRT